jgi:hypothetical protein
MKFKKKIPVSKVINHNVNSQSYNFLNNPESLHLFVKNSNNQKRIKNIIKFYNEDLIFLQPHKLVCLRSLKKNNKDFSFAKMELNLSKIKDLGEITCCIGQQGFPIRVKIPKQNQEEILEKLSDLKLSSSIKKHVRKSIEGVSQKESFLKKLSMVNSSKKSYLRQNMKSSKVKKDYQRQNNHFSKNENLNGNLSIITGHQDGYLILWKNMIFQEIIEKFESKICKIYKFHSGYIVLEERQILHLYCKNFFYKSKQIDLNRKINFHLPSKCFVNIFGNEKVLFLINKSLNVIKLNISAKKELNPSFMTDIHGRSKWEKMLISRFHVKCKKSELLLFYKWGEAPSKNPGIGEKHFLHFAK